MRHSSIHDRVAFGHLEQEQEEEEKEEAVVHRPLPGTTISSVFDDSATPRL